MSSCIQRPGKGAEAGRTARAGGRAGEDDRAAATRLHHLGDFAAQQEVRQRRHLPDLTADPFGGVGDVEAHVGADVEHRDLDRPDVAFDARHQCEHIVSLARVRAEGVRRAAGRDDTVDQRLQLVGAAPRHACRIAFARKAPRNGAAGGITGADHQGALPVFHGGLPCKVVGHYRTPRRR